MTKELYPTPLCITGDSNARAAGKTTSAARRAATAVSLDREAEAIAFAGDPDAALRDLPEPILLDEWQTVPGVLGAVKRAVDADPRPGRFLLTGSVRAELENAVWPGTGRLVPVAMYPMTVREALGRASAPGFFDRLAGGEELTVATDPSRPARLRGIGAAQWIPGCGAPQRPAAPGVAGELCRGPAHSRHRDGR